MTLGLFLTAASMFVGSALVLSELRWFRRPGLADRLTPYVAGAAPRTPHGPFSVASFREVIAPLAGMVGARVARLFGVSEELDVRLRRIHSPLEVSTFRVRQLAWASGSFLGAALLSIALGLPPALSMFGVLGSPVLTLLLLEQQVVRASEQWQRRLFLELPVVGEQLAMLTGAGWSLAAALHRVASRGSGSCAADLQRVSRRMQQGLGETEALREWSAIAGVDALDRLVGVLAMNREAADLGRLISEEARTIRREAQRELVESIERRNQQVWVPVTVAALIPGVLLMAVPFLDALTLFSAA